MNRKTVPVLLAILLLGLIVTPKASADVIVRYIIIDDGYHHREPFGYRYGSRLFSHSRYDDFYRGHHYRGDHYPPRHYRNRYYHGYRDRCEVIQFHRAHDPGDYGYHRDAPHYDDGQRYGIHRKYQERPYDSGRVHINIK